MENDKGKMKRAALSSIIFLALLPFIFFWRETLGRLTLGDQDAIFWFFPAFKFTAEQLKTGSLPLWTLYQYSGSPVFSQWNSGVFDPLNLIYLIEASSRTLTISLELSFALSLLTTFAYTRSLGFNRRASIISSVVYSLGGFSVARTLYPGLLHILALTPLVLYFVERIYQRGRWRDAAAGALIVAWQIFAAHAQPLVYSSLLAVAYALFRMRNAEGGRRNEEESRVFRMRNAEGGRRNEEESRVFRMRNAEGGRRNEEEFRIPHSAFRFLLQFTVMYIGGAGLAAVQLVPAWVTARQSVRQEWPFELFTFNSLHPLSLLSALFPFFHGSGRSIYHLQYWGNYWHHNEAQVYLGMPAIALAGAGAIFAWRCRHRIAIFWSIMALLGVILSLGKYSGPIAHLLHQIPLIGHFRSPNRYWMVVSLAVAVLAGYAVDRLLESKPEQLVRLVKMAGTVLLLFTAIVGGFLFWQRRLAESLIRRLPDLESLPEGFLRQAGAEYYVPVIFAFCGFIALLLFVRGCGRWYWPLLALMLIDFNHYAAFAPINNPQKLESVIGQALPATLAGRQNRLDPIRYHVMLNPAAGEFSPLLFYGHEMATGYDPLLNDRYKTFSGIDEAGRSFHIAMLQTRDRTLDLLNVRYVLVSPSVLETTDGAALNDGTRWREVEDRSPIEPYRNYRVFENLTALPRAWLVERVKVEYEGDQHKLIRGEVASNDERDFDPRREALVDHETAARLDGSLLNSIASLPASAKVKISERKETRMLMEADAAKPSILILSEIAYPGWEAKVDEKTAELLRVNYDLRGVALSAGKHTIEFIYRPLSLRIGAALSAISALGLILIVGLELTLAKSILPIKTLVR